MLGAAALDYSRWKKMLFDLALQRSALAAASCIHATSEAEYNEVRANKYANPVAIIRNGVEVPSLAAMPKPDCRRRSVLSLGRLHPKKGLERLVRAWKAVETDYPQWDLHIKGPAEVGHDLVLETLVSELKLERVHISGAVTGVEKWRAYRDADIFVLPTRHENFGMTVAEALVSEVPVICSKGAPWGGVVEKRCGWWVDQGVEPLSAALRESMSHPREDLIEMGKLGRQWMVTEFSWNSVARDMLDVYKWLTKGGEPPATVRIL